MAARDVVAVAVKAVSRCLAVDLLRSCCLVRTAVS